MSGWQPPGHPYQVTSRTAAEINSTDSPRSSGIYYPQIAPPIYTPPPQAASSNHLSHQHSSSSADGYTYVDQVGHLHTVPVVSRQQVLVSSNSAAIWV